VRQAGDDSYGRLVRRQQVERVSRELPINMLSVPIIVGACFAVYWSRIPHSVLFAWTAYVALVTLAGTALAFAYRRNPDKFRTRVWIRLFVVFALFDASNWALVPWLFFLPNEPLHHFFMAALVLGIAAGGQVAYVSILPAAAMLVIGVLLPTAARLVSVDDTIYYALAMLTVVFMAVVLSISRRLNASLIEAWRLSHRVEERTRELTAEVAERRKAVAEADSAGKAKDEFLSSMSHELRTPMNAILGFAQLLELDRDTKLDADQQNYLRQILSGGQHLLTLINEILELARIEARAVTFDRAPVAMRGLIDDSLDLLTPLAGEKSLTVSDETARTGLPPVLGDAMRIKQVIINLLSNAVKYTPAGGSVTLSSETTPNGRLRLSVTDTGPGINEDQHALLFQSFTRIGASSEQAKGTGIGLAICRHLVEHMDGEIGVDSAAGEGSTFWFEIPLAAEHEAPAPAAALSGEGARILLYIDANANNLGLIEEVLHRTPQVAMSWADSLELALELIKLRRPDAILIDIGGNGRRSLERLLNDTDAADIPIVAIVGESMPSQAESERFKGAHALVGKPIIVPDLIAALSSALNEGTANQPKA
jgi:signal transduction histidine kinase